MHVQILSENCLKTAFIFDTKNEWTLENTGKELKKVVKVLELELN